MKLPLYHLIVVLLLVSIIGCTPNQGSFEPIGTPPAETSVKQTPEPETISAKPIDRNYKAKGTVLDLENNVTHSFIIQRDDNLVLVDIIFSIDNKQYPGSIIYKANETYLLRKDPNQAVRFEKDAVVFGFLHPGVVNRDNIEVLKTDNNGYAIEYIIDGKSKVTLDSLNFVPIVLDFKFSADTRFFKHHEELYIT